MTEVNFSHPSLPGHLCLFPSWKRRKFGEHERIFTFGLVIEVRVGTQGSSNRGEGETRENRLRGVPKEFVDRYM